jgi:hypothetical protein
MFTRPTTLAAALVAATIKQAEKERIDPNTGKGNWIARRVALDIDHHEKAYVVREYDRSPPKPNQE